MKLAVIALGVLIGLCAGLAPAKCAHCPGYACTSQEVCGDCMCLRSGSAPGQCVSLTERVVAD